MTDHRRQLLARIGDRSARVAVIGLGYVGLPLAVDYVAFPKKCLGTVWKGCRIMVHPLN
jgi:UDP-N-acetyl-D-mannosaminuronate dehydrogenase